MRLEIILVLGEILVFINYGYQYLILRKFKINSSKVQDPLREYIWTMLIMSLVLFLAGIYLVFSDDSEWYNTLGVIILVFGISAFTQSFRRDDTTQTIKHFRREPKSIDRTLMISRILGLFFVVLGSLLFFI